MKCREHGHDAIAVCSNCGVGLCDTCAIKSGSGKYCCGAACIRDVSLAEDAARLTLERATRYARASAYGSYVLGLIFIGFAAFFLAKSIPGLALYTGIFGGGALIMGYLFQRSASNRRPVLDSGKHDTIDGPTS